MHRLYTKVNIGNGVRHRVVLTDEPSVGAEIVSRQVEFLQGWVNDGLFTGLYHCGPLPFQKMAMHHNGHGWVIVMEATEQL